MQFNWLNKQNNQTLLIFFNGWGMDANPLSKLSCDNLDVLEVNDYSSICPVPSFPEYKQSILIAWSLGVFAAAQALVKADLAIAINGTLQPVNETYGIDPVIFQGTIDRWDERGRNKFNRRMCGDRDTLQFFNAIAPDRSTKVQQQELIAIQDLATGNEPPENIFDLAIIGSGDRIIPPASQSAAWAGTSSDIINIEAAHYLFNRWNSWKEIINFAQSR